MPERESSPMSEWEISGRRALFEIDHQLGSGVWDLNTIRHHFANLAERTNG